MADVVYDRLSGLPPQQGQRNKDMGDGSFAPVSMGVAGFAPVQSLSGVSAIGPGLMLDNVGVRNNHSVVVVLTGTSTAATGVVQLQGSQDNVSWINLLPATNLTNATAPNDQIAPVTGTAVYLGVATLTPFRYIRAAVTVAIAGGGTVSAWVASAG